jgi:homoserine dehydrogenase
VHGAEIHAAAKRAGVMLGFEASVGGGIPIVKTLKEALAANRILSIYGIINGTCNYILTKMTEEGRSFEDVLREAQQAGYAEADPAFDVEGIDTAHKLAILVNLAFEKPIELKDVYTEGITAIRPLDIDFGKALGYNVKLLAIAKWHDGSVEARVHPTMVPAEYQIAKVGGVYNAIQVTGDACQDIMLYGRGAGSLPTGSAVVADIVDIARQILMESDRKAQPAPPKWELANPQLQPIESITSLYYLRLTARDQPGVLAQISGVLGRHRISIAQMIQRGRKQGGSVPLVIMTHMALEHDVQKALIEIKGLACVTEDPVLIRVEGEEEL